MSLMVINEQGSRVSRRGGQIVVKKEKQIVLVRAMAALRTIVLMGRVEISPALMGYALAKGIDVHLLSLDGRYKGKLSSPASGNVFLRLEQYNRFGNAQFRLETGRAVVLAKVGNYTRFLRKKATVQYALFRQRLNNLRRSIRKADSLNTLRGLEGSFSALYFRHLPAMLCEDFGFKKRIKHPPTDPLNILLSLSYSAVFANLYAWVESSGLDPYIGFFHDPGYGHPALVSDILEEFRAPLAEQHVFYLVNNRLITTQHFYYEDKVCRISKEGLGIFFNALRERISARFQYNGYQLNFSQVMEKQVQMLVRVIKGEEENYVGFRST